MLFCDILHSNCWVTLSDSFLDCLIFVQHCSFHFGVVYWNPCVAHLSKFIGWSVFLPIHRTLIIGTLPISFWSNIEESVNLTWSSNLRTLGKPYISSSSSAQLNFNSNVGSGYNGTLLQAFWNKSQSFCECFELSSS